MKKIVILLFALSSALNIFAQKIESDKFDDKGYRYIYCSLESIRSMMDKYVFFVSLNAIQSGSDTEDIIYDIFLRTNANAPLTVPKGGRLLIKLQNDSIIELKTDIEFSDKIGKVQHSNSLVYTNYSITPIFTVTTDQIEKISMGVKKIRLETTLEPIDKEFRKDKMGKILSAEYDLIKSALSQKKSFSDDF
mgnify:CR=1 FL=1|jgi:hypothetical protein